jgi:hypothetical protein
VRTRLTAAEKAKREEKRKRRAAKAADAPGPRGPVLGQLIARDALLRFVGKSTGALIREAEQLAQEVAEANARSVSCVTCTAKKACCWLSVGIPFHEALPVADRLRRDGRDTPELRAALATSADRMESHTPPAYVELREPCVLQGPDERCTVYDQRPRECGAAFVFSPPELCSDPEATDFATLLLPDELREPQRRTEAAVERTLGLQRIDGLYWGALPRMVLLALEAWDRDDFATYLAEQTAAAAERMAEVTKDRPPACSGQGSRAP